MSKSVIEGIGHVFYPESCPVENVKNFILSTYNCCMSPLHDRDLDSKGNYKKPHYHLLFVGKLSEKDKRFISKVTTMQHFENLYDINASYYYLYHWSRKTDWYIKDKAQYWSGDIEKGVNFNYDDISKDDNCIDNDDYILVLYDILSICNNYRDFYDYIFLEYRQDKKFLNYCISRNGFINNYYRNSVQFVFSSDSERVKSSNIRANRDFYLTDYKRSLYAKEVDENEFLLENFKSVDGI